MTRPFERLHPYLGPAPATQQGAELTLSAAQIDRACGVLLGSAAGDALGGPTGEWTAATAMAIPVAHAAAEGKDLCTRATQREVVSQWQHSTDLVLVCAAPLAIAYLDDEPRLVEAAKTLGRMAGGDLATTEGCVLWCLTLRHAVLTGQIEPSIGLTRLTDADTALRWLTFLDSVTAGQNPAFSEACAAAGKYAAIAGALIGAHLGPSSIPTALRENLHGWPGLSADDLVELTLRMLGIEGRDLTTAEPSVTA